MLGRRFPGAAARALCCLGVLALAAALSACTFTTDTAGTVGGQRITWGEVNAQVRATQQPPADAADFLVILRLLELEARAQGITVSESELDARIALWQRRQAEQPMERPAARLLWPLQAGTVPPMTTALTA